MTKTYKGDPISEQRTNARGDMKEGKITQDEAEAIIFIAEHDDHFANKSEVWDDPKDIEKKSLDVKLSFNVP